MRGAPHARLFGPRSSADKLSTWQHPSTHNLSTAGDNRATPWDFRRFRPSWRRFCPGFCKGPVINTVNNPVEIRFQHRAGPVVMCGTARLIRHVVSLRGSGFVSRCGVVHLTTRPTTGVIHNCGDPNAPRSGIARCGPQIRDGVMNYRRVSYQQCG